MEKVIVKVINNGWQQLPEYETPLSSGMDLRANIKDPIMIGRGARKLIPTGLHIGLPDGYEAQVRPRSGLALKNGITVLNAPGTIDADYVGEIGVILINLGDSDFVVQPGERIAQLVIAPVVQANLVLVSSLEKTERGAGGYGHTGVK